MPIPVCGSETWQCGRSRALHAALLASSALLWAAVSARAQDATWLLNPASGAFSTAANWSPAAVPTGTAFFGTSNTTSLSFSAGGTTIGGWTFNAGASNYSFTNGGSFGFDGAGIVINGGSAAITNDYELRFHNASTAGSASITNNHLLQFNDTSTAGSATITANIGGVIAFFGNSTGGLARLITNGGEVDLSTLTSASLTAGSIEGAGSYFLSTKTLTVGGNNLSTEVSGAIQDGGTFGGAGGSLVKQGTETLILSGTNTYTGLTTVNAGALQLGNGGTTGSIAGDVINNANFAINRSNAFSFGGLILGTGAFHQIGTGTTIFTANNAYTGATTLSFGTLRAGAVNAFAPASAFNVAAGAALDLNNFGQTIGSLAGPGTVTLGAATLTTGDNGTSTTFSGAIAGSGGITKAGGGTLILSGANTYTGLTTISNGTLRLGDGGTTGTIAGDVLDNANFAINRSDAFTFGGLISGTGAFQQIGTGTTIFTANNIYTGLTTISNGMLQLGNGGTTGSIVSDVLNNANLAINRSNAFSFGGLISGTGALQQNGTGITTLTANNTYTGATTVNAGTLRAGAVNAFAPASAFNVAIGAALDLNNFNQTIGSLAGPGTVTLGAATLTTGGDGTSTTFSGAIAGSGGVTKLGAGTLVLSGANTYTGLTTISNGALQLGAGGSTGAIAGDVLNNANFAINRSNAFTFGGLISGTGAFQQNGTGIFTLAGANTYTGATTVNAGTLLVDGSIATSSGVAVNNGATLGGTGIVAATTINSGGMLSPGNSIGTITIAGSLVFTSAAAYLVEVSPSSADRTNVIGTASLAGTVQAQFAAGSYVGRTYTILSSTGLGGTAFGALTTSNLPAGFAASLSYTSTEVLLNLTATLGALPGAGLAPNQQNVAGALNNFFNNGGTLPSNFLTVFGLTGGNLGNALTQLSGEAATGAQQGAFQMMGQFLGLMLDPLLDGRGGVAGGPAFGFAPERAALPEHIALAYAKAMKAPAYQAPPVFAQRWSVWASGFGGANNTNGDPNLGSHDLTARVAGAAAGADYRLAPDAVVGFALAGGGTRWDLAQGLGGGKSDAFQAGVYGATRSGPAYLAASLAYAAHWMSTDRIAFAGNRLTADFDAQSIGGRVEGGWRVATPVGGVAPYAALQAQSLRTPGYSETDVNGGGFGLSYNARTGSHTRSELGTRFDPIVAVHAGATLALRGRLAWAHDWVSDPSLTATFQALPGASFIVNGATPARDLALASAGAELRLAGGVTLLGKFDGEFASGAQTYAGTGTLRVSW